MNKKQYVISEELYTKLLNLTTLNDCYDTNVNLEGIDDDDSLNVYSLLDDITKDVYQIKPLN